MTALPQLSDVATILDENGRSAWTRLLEAEKFALARSADAPASNKREDLIIAARVIGFFLLDFRQHARTVSFAERAHRKLVQAVHSCWMEATTTEDECHKKVIKLGFIYKDHLIRVCMSRILLALDAF